MRPLRMSTAVLGTILGLLGLACGEDSNAPEPPPAATRIALNDGNNQSAAAGSAVAISPSVKVTDANASPVSGVAITFAVTSGNGSVTGESQTTNASGIATVGSWTLGPTAGANTLTATAAGLDGSPVTFGATGTLTFTTVSAGFVHTCGLTPTGAAYCWGANQSGQLGNGSTTEPGVPITRPVAVSGGQSFSTLTAGDGHTCGITTSGAAYCWGYNLFGQLGTGSTTNSSTPVAVSGNQIFSALVADGIHTCGLTGSGEAYCWGSNERGQLGVGTTSGPELCFVDPESPQACSTVPVPVTGDLTFSALAAGTFHSCGVATSGPAYCWGINDAGQLGNGSKTSSSAPVLVSGGQSFSALTAGNPYTCGLITSGAAYCWGEGDGNELGNGSFRSSLIPVPVAGGQTFTVLAAGSVHTCGIATSGAGFCWGETNGRLGNETGPSTPIAAVSGGLSFISIAAGDVHSCGVASSGLAYCWGDGYFGQLGDGTTELRRVPVLVAGQ
jgi:alpha-tubulin suppressor-like RCC1 family protein